jgi:hypothetical protein
MLLEKFRNDARYDYWYRFFHRNLLVRECGLGQQQVELASLNFASTGSGAFVKRAHSINSSVVGRRISGNPLARAIPQPASDNMFGRKLGQGKIGVVRRVQTPASDFVLTFDETAHPFRRRQANCARLRFSSFSRQKTLSKHFTPE